MAENQPPANVPPIPSLAMAHPTKNGNPNGKNQRKPVEQADVSTNDMDGMLMMIESERKLRVSAEKKLASAEKPAEKKLAVSEKLIGKMKGEAELLLARTKDEKAILTALLKSQKEFAKKELEATKRELAAEVLLTAAHEQVKKDANEWKRAIKKELKQLQTKYDALVKVSENDKTKISQHNSSLSSWMKTKTELDSSIKQLNKDLVSVTKRVDLQVEKKLDHELSLQELKNSSKQLELDLVRERLNDKLQNRKAPPATKTKSGRGLTLEEKKDFETHKAEVRKTAKENDAAREKLKKDTKASDIRHNLGFATNLMQNRTNGGMWNTGLVANVSSCLVFPL